MLNWTKVLNYIKEDLALPSSFIEKTDAQLQSRIELMTIPEFSSIYPDRAFAPIIVDNVTYKDPLRTSVYIIQDEEDLDVYSIIECYFQLGQSILDNHPLYGTFTFESVKWWALEVFKSRFFSQFSNYNYSYKFEPPNKISVIPDGIESNFLVHYEREQPHDLRAIPPSLKTIFLRLALAEIKIMIGTIRSHYGDGNISTPFGEIPLRGIDLLEEGKSEKEDLLDKMEEDNLPSIIMDAN